MFRWVVLVGLGMTGMVTARAESLTLAKDGRTTATLLLCDSPSPSDETAARELAGYLSKVTGGSFSVASESQSPTPETGIYVGDTAFARRQGVEPETMGPEEWLMRSEGKALLLVGGRPRGTLYAVYRFLEDSVGVHWWNPFEESVPKRPTLKIKPLDRRGSPTFPYRDIYMLYGQDGGRFAARNRLNRDGDSGISGVVGGEMGYGPPYHVHTFYMYVPPAQYFKAHPEWFSLINGERNADMAQLCLTNEELRGVFIQKLKAYIEQSRDRAQREGTAAPRVFDVSQNDWLGMCQCPACQAIAKAEGSEVGPLLDFVNSLADAIREEYPDVFIDTLAYMMTQKAPKTIRPRDNVIIRLCDTGSNFTKPITHPDNVKFREQLETWAKIAKRLRIWDYAVTYAPYYGLPLPSVHTYAPDYMFYAEHNVEGVFTEHEYPILADMRDLKVWMMMKTLEDPYCDDDALLREFTEGFYGEAGKPIRKYLRNLEAESEARSSFLSMGASPKQYRYLNLGFVLDSMAIFDQAERAISQNPVLLRRVRHARLPLDRAAAVLFPQLMEEWRRTGQPKAQFPLDLRSIVDRCKDTWITQIELRLPENERAQDRTVAEEEARALMSRQVSVAIPKQFRDLPDDSVFHYTAYDTRNWQDEAKRVQDAESEAGVANRLEISDEEIEKYKLPMPWGLYDQVNKQDVGVGAIRPEDVPGAGYHWVKMGAFKIVPSTYLYFFWSWAIQVDVDSAIDLGKPDQEFNVWARIKFEGPAFPHGKAEDKNAICIESVVLVKTGTR